MGFGVFFEGDHKVVVEFLEKLFCLNSVVLAILFGAFFEVEMYWIEEWRAVLYWFLIGGGKIEKKLFAEFCSLSGGGSTLAVSSKLKMTEGVFYSM